MFLIVISNRTSDAASLISGFVNLIVRQCFGLTIRGIPVHFGVKSRDFGEF